MDQLVEQAKELPDIRATRALVHDPSGGLEPHQAARARRPGQGGLGAAGRLLLPGSGRQRPCGLARGGTRRSRPDRLRDLSARALAPPRLQASRSHPRSRGWDSTRASTSPGCGRRQISLTSTSATRSSRRMRRGSRCARPSTTCPTGLVAALDTHLRAHASGDRLLETLEELQDDPPRDRLASARRADRPDPRLAGPDPRSLGQALRHGRRRVPRLWSRAATAGHRDRSIRPSSAPSRCSRTASRSRTTRRLPRTCARRPRGSRRARRSSS